MKNISARKRLPLLLCLLIFAPIVCAAQKPELVVQIGHLGRVTSIAFSPDGKTLASVSVDGTIKLWKAASGAELRTLRGHSGVVTSVAFSPDGETLASGGYDQTIRLWDVKSGTELRTLRGPYRIICVAFSPDGKTLASGSASYVKTVKLWDVESGMELRTLSGHPDYVEAVAFHPDGKTLMSASRDKTVKLWDAASGTELRTLRGHAGLIRSAAFSPDGKTLASGSEDWTIRLWDATNGTELWTLRTESWVTAVAFSPGGKILAGGSLDHTIRLWDATSGTELRTLRGHSLKITSVAFSPDGETLASGSEDGTVKLWATSSGDELRTLRGHSTHVTSIAFSPDGRTLAGGRTDGVIKLWKAASGTELRTFMGHTDSVASVAFSPDGKTLASGSDDKTIKLWDAASGTELRTLRGHAASIRSVAFSPDGKTLASGSWDYRVKLWDTESGAVRQTLRSGTDIIWSVTFTPDGRVQASAGTDKTIEQWNASQSTKLWDEKTGIAVRTLRGHPDSETSIAFSPDGKILASGSRDNTIKLWDATNGKEVLTLKGNHELISSVAFSPDGRTLASGGWDATIKLWNLNARKELASLIALDERDWAVVTPDGLFDGSPAAWDKIIWRHPQNTFDFAPVEAYFADFYYPDLLSDILAGRQPQAPADIAQKDRRQPEVRLSLISGGPASAAVAAPYVQLRVEVTESPAGGGQTTGSGARDVRLFRNGTLVRLWRGDVLKGETSASLEERIPIVAGENRFNAYAFNRDNVKSADSALSVTGAESLKRPATLYVLSVGINRYANAGFNLKYAVADAEEFGREWQRQQARIGRYAETVVVPLLDAEATKANILLAIRRLVEIETAALPTGAPGQLGKLKYANPEDGVVIYFAGHGTAQQSRFYLIPHDLGYGGQVSSIDTAGLERLLAHSISDRELEEAFERLNAGQLLMVLDACNSGQALEAEEKRRGPMNSKGLAQLAYEKGMYILTASQSFQAAQEASQLGHGLLTYVLIEEGLRNGEADGEPRDGTVLIREWLNYAAVRVPQMQLSEMKRARARGLNLSFREEERGLTIEERSGQRPRLFYRRELEAQPLVVAKPPLTRPKV